MKRHIVYNFEGSYEAYKCVEVDAALAAERAKHQELSDSYRAEIARLNAIIAERKECSASQVKAIRESPMGVTALCRVLGVTRNTIYRIRRGTTWKSIA